MSAAPGRFAAVFRHSLCPLQEHVAYTDAWPAVTDFDANLRGIAVRYLATAGPETRMKVLDFIALARIGTPPRATYDASLPESDAVKALAKDMEYDDILLALALFASPSAVFLWDHRSTISVVYGVARPPHDPTAPYPSAWPPEVCIAGPLASDGQ